MNNKWNSRNFIQISEICSQRSRRLGHIPQLSMQLNVEHFVIQVNLEQEDSAPLLFFRSFSEYPGVWLPRRDGQIGFSQTRYHRSWETTQNSQIFKEESYALSQKSLLYGILTLGLDLLHITPAYLGLENPWTLTKRRYQKVQNSDKQYQNVKIATQIW